jgi:hypothetical protein
MISRRDAQCERQLEQRTSTPFGITMDFSDEHPLNALHSIRQSFDGSSKMTSQRDLQEEKQSEQRMPTDLGMQIDTSDEQNENSLDEI